MLSAFWTASPSSLGRSTGPERPVPGAMASLVVPRLPSALRSGRRQRACAGRRSTAGCSPPFQQHLLPRFSRYDRLWGPAPTASLRQRCLRLRRMHVDSPPATPAAGPHSAPLVGGVPRRLWSAGCLAQTAADAARGRRRRCCGAPALWASPSCPDCVADATCRSPLPCPSLPSGKHTHTHTCGQRQSTDSRRSLTQGQARSSDPLEKASQSAGRPTPAPPAMPACAAASR